jgi:UDP-N-acetylmuramoylalanine--D-glutamate ligase
VGLGSFVVFEQLALVRSGATFPSLQTYEATLRFVDFKQSGILRNMTAYEEFFKDKKVTVLGLGLLGRGVGDVEFLAQIGAQVLVTDKKTEAELAESVEKLRQYKNVDFHLGGHRIEDFTSCDMVIKAAGVPVNSPYIAAARQSGKPVYMSTALFAKFAREIGATVVGITGTRGKSTVTQMIYHTLVETEQRLGLNRAEGAVGRTILRNKIVLGGNVRGVSTLALLPQITSGDIAVLELDSWQLQGFGDLKISPQVSVFTNLMPDHQNYYSSMDEYFNDKANIFKYQYQGAALICGAQIVEKVNAARPQAAPLVPNAIPADWKLKIPGEHNRANAALAAEALKALKLTEQEIRAGLESFEGVEGRLQFVREIREVKIYNDNNATTPEATIAALKALNKNKNVILIAGGSDKGLDMSKLLYEIAGACKRVILLPGTGTDRIVPLMQEYSVFDSLEAAVHEAVKSAEPGDTILFSPAFASFGMFKNEYERNDEFMSTVNTLR